MKTGLKAAPDETFFFLKKVKLLGHVISPEGIQPIAKRVEDLKNLNSPESKRNVVQVLECLGYYSLLYQKPPCGQSALLRFGQGLNSLPLDTRTRKFFPINQRQNQ